MEFGLILILSLIIAVFLFVKMFKTLVTFIGLIVLSIMFAFLLRSYDVINFDVPAELTWKSFNFSINYDKDDSPNSEKDKVKVNDLKEKSKPEKENSDKK